MISSVPSFKISEPSRTSRSDAFQVVDGSVVKGLPRVLLRLEIGIDSPWMWAQWLNAEWPDADPPRKIQYLYDGRLGEAIRDARHAARAWNS
jgi:hypothetical protein